jgi:bacteriorhodopsin
LGPTDAGHPGQWPPVKYYPLVVSKVVKMHKATTGSPLFFLNIAFGIALLFFVVSSFLMFLPKLPQYKQGLKIAAAGFVFVALFVMLGV